MPQWQAGAMLPEGWNVEFSGKVKFKEFVKSKQSTEKLSNEGWKKERKLPPGWMAKRRRLKGFFSCNQI